MLPTVEVEVLVAVTMLKYVGALLMVMEYTSLILITVLYGKYELIANGYSTTYSTI